MCRKFFKVDGKPVELSDGQALIFANIFFRLDLRVQIICPTQYGKSFVIALAVICRATATGEMFNILAPSEKKAGIIMGYIIDHLFDHEIFYSQLELDTQTSMDKLRRERSKRRVTFLRGGGVQTLTLDARNAKKSIEAAMGFGGNRIIIDEASLVEDRIMSSVIRMLGGFKYDDTFLLKIGNPFYRNHFRKTWIGDRYSKIFIDYHQALKEGRYEQEFIDEMREEEFFDVYYECQFPPEGLVDDKGYRQLVVSNLLKSANVSSIEFQKLVGGRLGIDIGGGGDKSTYVLRNGMFAKKLFEHNSVDTHINVELIREVVEEYELLDENIFIDDTGIGRGVSDYCVYHTDDLMYVNPISNAQKAERFDKYVNARAENYMRLRRWLKNGGKIEKADDFKSLIEMKYKTDTSERIIIEKKELLKQRIGRSPDNEDGLALTFANKIQRPDIVTI